MSIEWFCASKEDRKVTVYTAWRDLDGTLYEYYHPAYIIAGNLAATLDRESRHILIEFIRPSEEKPGLYESTGDTYMEFENVDPRIFERADEMGPLEMLEAIVFDAQKREVGTV